LAFSEVNNSTEQQTDIARQMLVTAVFN